jgi:hypothetical protein
LINTALSAHDKMVIDAYEKIVVHLPAKGYGTTEFNMSTERRDLLVAAGRAAMAAYFSQNAGEVLTSSSAEAERNAAAADRVARRILARSIQKKAV